MERYITDRRNPNDVDFEKDELRISQMSMLEARDESFIAHRAKAFEKLDIKGS